MKRVRGTGKKASRPSKAPRPKASPLKREEILANISSRLINVAPDQLDSGITAALGLLGRAIAIDRVYILQVQGDDKHLGMTHEWKVPNIDSAIPVAGYFPKETFSWLLKAFKKGQPYACASLSEIPATFFKLREIAVSRSIKSFVLVPLLHSNALLGILGFSAIQRSRRWPKQLVRSLSTLGEIFSSALQRQRIEQALTESETRWSNLIESLGEGVLHCDREDVILHVNSRMADLAGYAPAEMIGLPAYELLLPPTESRFLRERTARRLAGISEQYEIQLSRKNGTRFWASISATPIRNAAGDIIGTLGAVSDITERKRAEEELVRQKDFLRLVIDTNPNLIFAKDRQGRFTLVNQAVADIYGSTVENLLGKTDADFNSNRDEVEQFRRADSKVIDSAQPLFIPEERVTNARTGEEHWFQTIKIPLPPVEEQEDQLLGIASDITARKSAEAETMQLQRQLLQAQKMEAIGQLAAGIAHDLNNALSAVVGHLQLLKMSRAEDFAEGSSVDIALTGCTRATSLIEQLLGFSRQGKYRLQDISIQNSVKETIDFLSRVIGQDVRIIQTGIEKPLMIRADASQLQQALTNLIINAKHAMPAGGIITFNFDRQPISDPGPYNPRAPAGNFVLLRVTDTGTGIEPEHLDKIFEPFFTTKSAEQGTGLGLSMVYGFMQNHGGWVKIDSTLGRGSTFTLYFPEVSVSPVKNLDKTEVEMKSGVGRILVIDDEQALVELSREFLVRAGFSVTGFSDSKAALTWFKDHPDEIDLTILDMKMPRLDGQTCFHALRAIKPNLPIVILSGYIQDSAAQDVLTHGAVKFFTKPVHYPALVEWILNYGQFF